MMQIPQVHYAFALKRTDGGPPYISAGRCKTGCDRAALLKNARERAQAMLDDPRCSIQEVHLLRVTYSVQEILL